MDWAKLRNTAVLAGSGFIWWKYIRPLPGKYYVPLTIGGFFLMLKLLKSTATVTHEELSTSRQQFTINDNGTTHTVRINAINYI